MHYDFADTLYGNELSNRAHWTATIENFKADKWGSTYFFVDGNFANNTMESAYAELSRELRFWEVPIAIHVEYNGGLSGGGSYNDAYLAGGAWNWANKLEASTVGNLPPYGVSILLKEYVLSANMPTCGMTIV